MHKEEDRLRDFLQEHFSGYNHPVKNDLWLMLDKELPKKNAVSRRFYRIAASVAAILTLAFCLLPLIHKQTENKKEALILKEDKNLYPEILENIANEEIIKQAFLVEKIKTNFRQKVRPSAAITVPDTIFHAETNNRILGETIQDTAIFTKNTVPENFMANIDDLMSAKPGLSCCTNRKNIQIALASSNFFASNTNMNRNAINESIQLRSYSNVNNIGSNVANAAHSQDELIRISYKFPVNLGLFVRKNLTGRWAVETGLSYTYSGSQETWKSVEYDMITTNDINLHYLGVPLKASYTLYNYGQWSVYLAGGGMFEKCVYGEIQTKENSTGIRIKTKLDTPEWPISLVGNAGINYRIIRSAGIFIEPGFVYFFNDGSEIMTIRKDKPLIFNLHGGLRFDF
ncbi:MAG: PorT family protein [Dysgonamonadaceae bacterium]|jgi:hypothetical protein|nr:PorT family protein [Dysgonamonadaceae bacterium]